MVVWRWLDRLMGGLFFLSAVVQYNDPDPLRWMVMYGSAAVVCWAPDRIGLRAMAAWVVSAVAMFWALQLAPQALGLGQLSDLTASMTADRPEVEAARECLGLAIVALWTAGLGVRGQWKRSSATVGG